MRRVKLDSGMAGYRCRLQNSYESLGEFRAFNSVYGLAKRLGFRSAIAAWRVNPIIQGGVIPSDFRVSFQ
jgi:hypothetical protein